MLATRFSSMAEQSFPSFFGGGVGTATTGSSCLCRLRAPPPWPRKSSVMVAVPCRSEPILILDYQAVGFNDDGIQEVGADSLGSSLPHHEKRRLSSDWEGLMGVQRQRQQ